MRASFDQLLRVVVPGADAIANAGVSAAALGEFELAQRLNDLGIALTNLVLSPSDPIAKSQAIAAIDAIDSFVNADPFLAPLYDFAIAHAQLAAASTLDEIQLSLDRLARDLTDIAIYLADIVKHGFTFGLATNVVTALPGVPAMYPILLENTGTEATTFDFFAFGLPFDVTASFSRQSVTLQPGERLDGGPNGVFLILTFTGNALFPATFTVQASPQEAPNLSGSAEGSVAVRAEFVQVAVVTPTPAFTNPGGSVAVAGSAGSGTSLAGNS